MIWFFSLIADVTFWILLFFSKDDLAPVWRAVLAVIWFGLWALTYFVPASVFAVMAMVAVIDIGLLYAVFGEYASRV
jgi:hypothetical protein